MIALYILLVITALIMLLLLIPIDCRADFSYNKDNKRGEVILKYAFVKVKLFPNERELKEAEQDAEEEAAKEEKELDPWGVIDLAKAVYEELWDDITALLHKLLKHTLRVKELNISAKFGTGNPMYTGIVTGIVNSAVYNTVAMIDNSMQLDRWNVSLESDFDSTVLCAGVYCVIRTRCISVIALGLRAALLLLRIQKINRRISKNG